MKCFAPNLTLVFLGFCLSVPLISTADTSSTPQRKLAQWLPVLENQWSDAQKVEPAMNELAALGRDIIPELTGYFEPEASRLGHTNISDTLKLRLIATLGRVQAPEAEIMLSRLIDPDNTNKRWLFNNQILIQLQARKTERAMAEIADIRDPGVKANRVSLLSSNTFAWVVTHKQNMWNTWYADPSVLPLRKLGTNAVPWVLENLRHETLPKRPGGFADNIELAVALLSEFGDSVAADGIKGLLNETQTQRQWTHSVALGAIVHSLLQLNDPYGVEYCVKELAQPDLKNGVGHHLDDVQEALTHNIGDSVLKEKGYRDWSD